MGTRASGRSAVVPPRRCTVPALRTGAFPAPALRTRASAGAREPSDAALLALVWRSSAGSALAADAGSVRRLGQRDDAPADARRSRSFPTTSGSPPSSPRSGTLRKRPRSGSWPSGAGLGTTGARACCTPRPGRSPSRTAASCPSGRRAAPWTLEGVGAYTAGAVASIAFGRRAAVVDGNVARVLARLFAIEDDVKTARGNARLWRLAEELVPDGDGDPGDWNQALMELGATVCVPRAPQCEGMPRDAPSALGRERGHRRAPAADRRRRRRRSPCSASRSCWRRDRAVLLARRRRTCLFGGLWEPPSARTRRLAELAALLGVDPAILERRARSCTCSRTGGMRVEVARGPPRPRRRWPLPGPEYDAVECVALGDVGVARAGDRSRGRCSRWPASPSPL